jgi:hypothetical protein
VSGARFRGTRSTARRGVACHLKMRGCFDEVVPGELGARDLVVKRQLQARDLTAMMMRPDLLIGRVVMKRELLRRRDRVLLLAALVVGLTVPLGFALSVPSSPTTSLDGRRDGLASSVVMSGPLRLSAASPTTATPNPLVEAIKLAAVGSLLMGFASIARRA